MARLRQDLFKIFISHKNVDAELASAAADDGSAAKRGTHPVKCFVSGEDIDPTADWEQVIRRELNESHLLILLYTTPDLTWDWCLYETGLFMRFDDEVHAVACLTVDDPPAPLGPVQGVRAHERASVQRFLELLCLTPWKVSDGWMAGPIAPAVTENRLKTAAQRIVDAFKDRLPASQLGLPGRVRHPCHRVVLDLTPCKGPYAGIPEDAVVDETPGQTEGFTLSLFGATAGTRRWRWGELLDRLSAAKEPWRRRLDEFFDQALREELYDRDAAATMPPLRSFTWTRLYRPVLYELSTEPAAGRSGAPTVRPTRVTIILDPILAPPVTGGLEFQLLRINDRFRTEVFERFDLRGLAPDEVAATFERLQGALRLVEAEAEGWRIFDTAQVQQTYGPDYESSGVTRLGEQWLATRADLDEALKGDDAAALASATKLLACLRDLNHEFTTKAAERYLKAMAEGWTPTADTPAGPAS